MPIIPNSDRPSFKFISREFLEDYPLYRNFSLTGIVHLSLSEYPSIKTECPECRDVQTFTYQGYDHPKWAEEGPFRQGGANPSQFANKSLNINYQCQGCSSLRMSFLLRFSPDAMQVHKAGQSPQKSIRAPAEIQSALGSNVDFYKKGLICESLSYGIGAFAYYRRLMEAIILDLLNSAKDLLDENVKSEYQRAIDAVAQDHTADEKIRIATSMLPSMSASRANPLRLIYEMLSVGLHGLNDEECLGLAIDIRKNIVAFVHQLNLQKESQKVLSDSTAKLLQKKSELLAKKQSM